MPQGYASNYHKQESQQKQNKHGYASNYHEQEGMKLDHMPMPADSSHLPGQPHEGKFYGTNTVGKGPSRKTNV